MSTPYLDEAERCSRVALMNQGKVMVVDTPQNVKSLMKGEIVEVVCEPIREAFNLLKKNPLLLDVQAFGDRLNVIMENSKRDFSAIEKVLKENQIHLHESRTISPSLENVFISLLQEEQTGS
jgi:ABC-2 type transport system ATP-binding protein